MDLPKNLQGLNVRTIYAQKTIDGRGGPRQMDDKTIVQGYMVDNFDGTYSNYFPDGTLEKTYVPNNGFFGGLSAAINSVVSDTSGVIGNFILPAAAMAFTSAAIGANTALSTVEAATAVEASTGTNLFAYEATQAGYGTFASGEVAAASSGLTAAEFSMVDAVAAGAAPTATSFTPFNMATVEKSVATVGLATQVANSVKNLVNPTQPAAPGQNGFAQQQPASTASTQNAMLFPALAAGLLILGALG